MSWYIRRLAVVRTDGLALVAAAFVLYAVYRWPTPAETTGVRLDSWTGPLLFGLTFDYSPLNS